jgi:rubrerythrin
VGADLSAGGYGRRRGFGRVACLLALALTALTPAAAGCGGSGHGAETDPEKGSDAAILNEGLARELTALDAYTRGNGLLRGRERALGRQLRAQEQEYVDALTKAIRGLGGDTEAEAEKPDFSQIEGQAAFLALAYDLESAARDFYVDQAARLYTAAPRTLDAWLAAGHGGHVALLPDGGG